MKYIPLFCLRFSVVATAGLVLAACAPLPPYQTLPPAPQQAQPVPPPPVPEVVVRPLEMPEIRDQPLQKAAPEVIAPQEPTPALRPASPAVLALMNRARLQADLGEMDQAAASLERAIRIEPQNALLWLELARIKLHQGNPSQAEQMALRAVRFATDDRTEREAWAIVALARQSQGDIAGAAEARRKAGQ